MYRSLILQNKRSNMFLYSLKNEQKPAQWWQDDVMKVTDPICLDFCLIRDGFVWTESEMNLTAQKYDKRFLNQG